MEENSNESGKAPSYDYFLFLQSCLSFWQVDASNAGGHFIFAYLGKIQENLPIHQHTLSLFLQRFKTMWTISQNAAEKQLFGMQLDSKTMHHWQHRRMQWTR